MFNDGRQGLRAGVIGLGMVLAAGCGGSHTADDGGAADAAAIDASAAVDASMDASTARSDGEVRTDAGTPDSGPPDAGQPDGTPGVDACTPATCASLGYTCGPAPDGCGGTVQCGQCGSSQLQCRDNQCVCAPVDDPCAYFDAECGEIEDNCGNPVDCGGCEDPQRCNETFNDCRYLECSEQECLDRGARCGVTSDGCSCNFRQCPRTLSCGEGSQDNVCGRPLRSTEGLCSEDGWCWELPRPHGHTLRYVQVFGPSNVWAASRFSLFHYDGSGWNEVTTPDAVDSIGSLWAPSPGEPWLLVQFDDDRHVVLRRQGQGWTEMEPPMASTNGFGELWGTASDDVWLPRRGKLLHWDGSEWSTVDPAPSRSLWFNAVSASGPDDIWAVGDTVVHYDGQQWSTREPPVLTDLGSAFTGLHGVRALAPDDVWIWGIGQDSPWVVHWDGSEWQSHAPSGSFFPSLPSLWGSEQGVWLVSDESLFQWDEGWDPLSQLPGAQLLGASGPGNLWAVGRRGAMWRWDGSEAHRESVRGFGSGAFSDLLSLGGGEMWAIFQANLFHRTDAGWMQPPRRGVFDVNVRSVGASGPNDVWALGWHYDDEKPVLEHYDGTEWTITDVPSTMDLDTMAVGPSGDIWILEPGGPIHRYDGSNWTMETPDTSAALNDLAASSGGVWAVGEQGTILRRNGSTWMPVSTGTDASLSSVAAEGDQAWAVGEGGTTLHWDGSGWSAVPSSVTAAIDEVALGGGEVWARVGPDRLLHRSGGTWSSSATPEMGSNSVRTLEVGPGGTAWAGGSNSMLLRHSGM